MMKTVSSRHGALTALSSKSFRLHRCDDLKGGDHCADEEFRAFEEEGGAEAEGVQRERGERGGDDQAGEREDNEVRQQEMLGERVEVDPCKRAGRNLA